MTGRLLTAADVAEILGVRESFVYALARRGDLPRVAVGDRHIRFRAEAIETWIRDHETTDPKGSQ